MRKYMAAMLQALNTTQTERQWVLDHLGHTIDVHRVHFRHTSDMIERVDVAKILLIQDMGLVSKYRGKSLGDIQLTDMLQDLASDDSRARSSMEQEIEPIPNITTPDDVDEYIPDMANNEDEEDEEDYELKKLEPKKPEKPTQRQSGVMLKRKN